MYKGMSVDLHVWHFVLSFKDDQDLYMGISLRLLSHWHSLIFQMTIQKKMSEQSKEQTLKSLTG